MPLLNRIEISNFMNSRREDPWRPDWTLQLFDLKGENTAINMPNGRGKSTLVLTALAMLAHDKSLNELRKNHFAPQSMGHYTHVRIETTVWVDDESPVDLAVQAGGEPGGIPMVFGLYGNAGESASFKLYSYQGILEDCPIGRREGNRVTLTPNKDFLEKLSVMPKRFPSTQRDDTRVNWREYVSGTFDMPSIEQQLVYQKAKGAEGSSGYFDVNPPRGRQFSEAVFYERLAPELLVDMMGSVEEFSNERGIEDTIHQKVQGIIKAKVRTAKTAGDLEKTKRILEELDRIKGKADSVIEAKEDTDRKVVEFSRHHAALKAIVVDAPIPGIPRMPPEEAPILIRSMVMQNGNWYLPDRAFEIFTGEKSSHINERAGRQLIKVEAAEKSQLVAFYCDLKIRDDRGNPNKLYNADATKAILSASTNFKSPYTRETAIQAASDAFAWVETNGDTNPARLERRELKAKQAIADEQRKEYAEKRDTLQGEINVLKEEQQQIGQQQAEFRNMSNSGLFSETELQSPAATGLKVETEFNTAENTLAFHRKTVAENKTKYFEWQEFVSKNGKDLDPSEYVEMLEQTKGNAEDDLEKNKSELNEAKSSFGKAKTDADQKQKAYEKLSEQSDKLEQLRPLALIFAKRFVTENPDGLWVAVKKELQVADKRLAEISTERAGMIDALESLSIFSKQHGSDTNPKVWLEARAQERSDLTTEMFKIRDAIEELKTRRKDLDKAVVAPGKVAREVLDIAGTDAKPLHAVIDEMNLPKDRKERVLSMFSALLFSPVYDDAALAAEVAGKLASHGVESPVFVSKELADYCRGENIIYDGSVARTWLVGVRTRPVDCLLDPTLVEREKVKLDEQIIQANGALEKKQERFAELDPEGLEAITARKAREAIEKSFVAKDGLLLSEASKLDENLPRLKDRASDEAGESIRGVVEYRRILGDSSEDALAENLAKAEEVLRLSQKEYIQCEENFDKLTARRDILQNAFNDASVKATEIPKLKRIKEFMDADGPELMESAVEREQDLNAIKVKSEKRKAFRFALADTFVKSGDNRPKEIEKQLSIAALELTDIVDNRIPEAERVFNSIGERLPELEGSIAEIDSFIRELRKKYREMATADCLPVGVSPEELAAHPLCEAVLEVHRAISSKDIAKALLAMRAPLEDIEATTLKHDVDNARKTLKTARDVLSGEVDRVNGDSTIAMNEQMRIGLESSKDDIGELVRMIQATTDNYGKSLAANETARQHLDNEWADIGSWLENFTRRLPSNFEAMRSVFRPVRESVSGEIISAGFDIDAKVADMNDVRTVLTSIVDKVEKSEKNREALGEDENLRSRYDSNMRKEIREEFYKNVILEPTIRVCIPSISRKPLKLEKNMVSSGQGVAMTLLWIVKMADYVTERELQRQNVSNAARRKVRSMRTQFVIIDGAFSHLSDKRLITDALDGVKKTRGKFQLVITGHDPNYKNDFAYFPSYIVAREIGGNLMYAESETRRIVAPEEVGSRIGAMELASFHRLKEVQV